MTSNYTPHTDSHMHLDHTQNICPLMKKDRP